MERIQWVALSALLLGASGCAFEGAEVEGSASSALSGGGLVVNECTTGTSGSIELYNAGTAALDLASDPANCWFVDDIEGGGSRKRIVDGVVNHAAGSTTCASSGRSATCAIVAPGERVWVSYAYINSASADQCRLVSSTLSAGTCGTTYVDEMVGGPTASTAAGQCFGRVADGAGWSSSAISCSPNGGTNGEPEPPPPPPPPPVVVTINEFSAGNAGWVELHNASAVAADLSGWVVDDIAGGTAPKTIPAGTTIAPGGFVSIAFSGFNTASADEVRLLDATGAVVDSHSNFYAGTSISNLCFGRQPNGGAWAAGATDCTRDASNDKDAVLVSVGNGQSVILRGTIITPDNVLQGEVLIENDIITCVAASCAGVSLTGTPSVVETNGIIAPGMIDAHNHILFDIFDESDWAPTKAYANHNQWPNDPRYGAMVDAKQYLNGEYGSSVSVGCELNKYGELKGLISGTTSIVGAANPANKACYGSVARTIDQTNDLGYDKIQAATLTPLSKATADSVCENIAEDKTDAFVVHAGEGIDQASLNEFNALFTAPTTDGCLHRHETAIVHGTAFGANEFSQMGALGMSLVWSPRSNVFLYGMGTDLTKTTNIPLALSYGINVALAPDWSIGGSQNLLDELRFANQVDDGAFGNILTPKDLVKMVTIQAAKALAIDNVLGSIEVGKKADLFVIGGDTAAPYDSILAATPSDVRLVLVNGVPLYGDTALLPIAPSTPGCETLDVCTMQKFVCVAEPGGTATNKLGQTLAQIKSVLETELTTYDNLDLSSWDFMPLAPLVKCGN
jgi:hypothetical protein